MNLLLSSKLAAQTTLKGEKTLEINLRIDQYLHVSLFSPFFWMGGGGGGGGRERERGA